MNYKKCVSIVESMSKKIGKSPLYWQNEQGIWISDTGGIFNIGEVLMIPKNWRVQDMSQLINENTLQSVAPAEKLNLAIIDTFRFGLNDIPGTRRLFCYGGLDYAWFNQLYLEPFKNDDVRYSVKDNTFLLIRDKYDYLRAFIMKTWIKGPNIDSIKAFAERVGA